MKPDSELYSWRYITADQILKVGRCELLYVLLAPSAAAATCTIYDGIDASGDIIFPIYLAVQLTYDFTPPKPINCKKGLFVDIGANVTGVLVIWRDL